MPNYSTPGVYVNETPLQSRVNVSFSTSTAAFFGESSRGPVDPTLVSSWSQYQSLFGLISPAYELGYALYHYFSNGGRNAYVTRVLSDEAESSTATAYYYPTGIPGASVALFTATAVSPGAWGNGLAIKLTAGLVEASATVIPTFNVLIYDGGVEVERWTELSPELASSRYFPTVLNNYSRYVRVSDVASVTANANLQYDTATQAFAGGIDGVTLDDDYLPALDKLDNVEGVLMINAVGKYTSTVNNAVMAKAKERGNSIAIIDPSPLSTSATDFVSEAATYRAADGANYSIFCAPMLTMVDPAKTGPGAIRRTFPGGAVAGLYARTETERTVAKSPAGFTADIRNALGVDIKFSETEIGNLYDNGVNCFKAVPGGGIVLWGARTLERLRPDQYISVRRSLNYLKQALKDATQFAVFEPNDERLWTSITAACGSVLNAFWSAGGLKGASASDAYYVVCDETNNTATTIDNGEVRVEVGVAVQYPAEFIVINISQWTGGSNAVDNL
jgi:phage tail sheath protein FI